MYTNRVIVILAILQFIVHQNESSNFFRPSVATYQNYGGPSCHMHLELTFTLLQMRL